MRIIESARKHGVLDDDIKYVYETATKTIILRDNPTKIMIFGFDRVGRCLEVGYIIDDEGEDVVIHAMKIRRSYIKYMNEQ
ncbi:MAG: hypothetical protein LBR61_09165 [Synergistaceae bacterium]|jgi:hypothetical protein|nr:hypothetical protein [Synergistaceae bacterium]